MRCFFGRDSPSEPLRFLCPLPPDFNLLTEVEDAEVDGPPVEPTARSASRTSLSTTRNVKGSSMSTLSSTFEYGGVCVSNENTEPKGTRMVRISLRFRQDAVGAGASSESEDFRPTLPIVSMSIPALDALGPACCTTMLQEKRRHRSYSKS